jgi:two-component system sensor histidine kinase DegS
VREILHSVEAEIKRIIHHLRPPTLDALGLAPALRRYAQQFHNYSGLPCSVQVIGEPQRLPSKIEVSVYRLVQEALQNASAHAEANHTKIVVDFAPKRLKLTVEDDGKGFDLQKVRKNSNGQLGLLGMKERTEALGGQLAIRTASGQGTCVELSIPVEAGGQAGSGE